MIIAAMRQTPSETPTPMPALAPVERPEWFGEVVGVLVVVLLVEDGRPEFGAGVTVPATGAAASCSRSG